MGGLREELTDTEVTALLGSFLPDQRGLLGVRIHGGDNGLGS